METFMQCKVKAEREGSSKRNIFNACKDALFWGSIMTVRYFRLRGILIFIMLILPCITHAGEAKSEKGTEDVSNKLLVKFYSEVTDEKKVAIRKALGAELIKCLKEIRFEVWELPEGLSVNDAINKLKAEPSVECSEPDYIYRPQYRPGEPQSGREFYPDIKMKEESVRMSGLPWNKDSYISGASEPFSVTAGI